MRLVKTLKEFLMIPLLGGILFVYSCRSDPGYSRLVYSPSDSANMLLRNQRAFALISKYKPALQSGDMLLRTGNDFTSESLRLLSLRDRTYSHCGIVSVEHDSVFVYHALGGEWNPDEKLRRDPVELFCNPLENRGFGIFRFDLNGSGKARLDSIVKAWYQQGIMFDMKFDLATDDRMYCAEFVSKAVTAASCKAITFETTTINNFRFVAVDNLFLNRHCKEIARVRYQ